MNQTKKPSVETSQAAVAPTGDVTMNLTRSDKSTPIDLIEDLKQEAARRDPRNRQPSTAEVLSDIQSRAPEVVP